MGKQQSAEKMVNEKKTYLSSGNPRTVPVTPAVAPAIISFPREYSASMGEFGGVLDRSYAFEMISTIDFFSW